MGFDINKYFTDSGREEWGGFGRVVCKDGFAMSVQASRYSYCVPRITDAAHYSHVEVGFPTERVEALMEFVEDADNPLDTVYSRVPVETINLVVDYHGGLKNG